MVEGWGGGGRAGRNRGLTSRCTCHRDATCSAHARRSPSWSSYSSSRLSLLRWPPCLLLVLICDDASAMTMPTSGGEGDEAELVSRRRRGSSAGEE